MSAATPWIERSAGVLLHLSSLPLARIDAGAARYTQWLANAGVRLWQMLPVGPVDAYGSPFSSTSGFAGNLHLLPPGVAEPSGFDDFRDANADWLDDWTLFCALDAEFPGQGWWQWPESLRDRQPAEMAAARRRHAAMI